MTTRRILIVDDDPVDAGIAKARLRGHEVEHASSLTEALEVLARATFDVVLLDMNMPDGQGPDLVRRVLPRAPNAAIVVLSGSGRENPDAQKALQFGAQDWLTKEGLDSDRLNRAVDHAIERKAFERRIAESDERFRQLADNTDAIFWIMTADLSKVLYVNAAYDRIWGSSRDRLYEDATDWQRLVEPPDRQRVADALVGLGRGTGGLDLRFRMRRPDNALRWIHIRGFAVRDLSGAVYRIAGTAHDVTELYESEQRVEQANRRLSSILESAGEGICGMGFDGRITFANSAAGQLLGDHAADVVGVDAHDLFHERQPGGPAHPREACPLIEVLRDGRPHRADEHVFWRKDGEPLWVSYVATPKSVNRQIEGAVVVFADITERRRVQEALVGSKRDLEAAHARLEELQRLRVQLLNNIVHDMGTPLMVLQLRLDGIAEEPPSADGGRVVDARTFDSIQAATRQLTVLTRDLRDVALMEAGAFRLHLRETDVARLVRSTTDQLSDIAARADVRLVAEVLPGHVLARADDARLAQALINVVTNAIKFTPPKGQVTLRVGRNTSMLHLDVADTGPGIPEEARAGLFRPFSQVHTDTDVKKGSGLGLYIVRGIMRAHGGDAVLLDGPRDKGATFRLSLPAGVTSAP